MIEDKKEKLAQMGKNVFGIKVSELQRISMIMKELMIRLLKT